MSDTIETQLTAILTTGDYIDLRALRDVLAPNDIRDAAKLIDVKKLREARAHLESNGLVAVRASSAGKFEVHVDLALEYVLYRNKDLKTFVTNIRSNRPGGIRGLLESTPGVFERVQTVFGDAGNVLVYLPMIFLKKALLIVNPQCRNSPRPSRRQIQLRCS